MTGYDPFDPVVRLDPYPVYAWLRDDAPVHHSPETDTFVLSRHDDVSWALADTDLFSSDAMLGVLLGQPLRDRREGALPLAQESKGVVPEWSGVVGCDLGQPAAVEVVVASSAS